MFIEVGGAGVGGEGCAFAAVRRPQEDFGVVDRIRRIEGRDGADPLDGLAENEVAVSQVEAGVAAEEGHFPDAITFGFVQYGCPEFGGNARGLLGRKGGREQGEQKDPSDRHSSSLGPWGSGGIDGTGHPARRTEAQSQWTRVQRRDGQPENPDGAQGFSQIKEGSGGVRGAPPA